MSIFHYKAELLKQNANCVFYKFYPDFIGSENVFGEFQIELKSWNLAIIDETEIEGQDSFYCNDRPVSALTYKIKKSFEEKGEFPSEVFHIA